MRLKVQLNDNRAGSNSGSSFRKAAPTPLNFVYVLDSPNDTTIDALIDRLEAHLVRQFSIKNARIVQLLTDDGYILPRDHYCSHVLADNERVRCYNMEQFVQDNYSTLDFGDLWCELKQHDASDNLEKTVQVGLNNLSKLFIRMYGSSTAYGLYLFSAHELRTIASERREQKRTIARLGQSNWFLEAAWEYDPDDDAGLFLICQLKIGSSDQIWSSRLRLVVNQAQMSIEKGELTSLSGQAADGDHLTDDQRERLTTLISAIPPATRLGPEIDVNRDANKKITKHECGGDSLVRMANGSTNTITAQQDSRTDDSGTFRQHFVITHVNFFQPASESSDKPLSVTNVTIRYQSNDGQWYECEDTAIATIALRGEEPRWLADPIVRIEPDKVVSIAVKGWIRVRGTPGRDNATRRRIHKTLPQPFKLQIVAEDNTNAHSTLVVEQLNPPLDYDTSDSFVKYNQSSIAELVAFVYADDCEVDERLFLAVYLDREHQLVIKSGHSYSISLDRKAIRTMEYNAKRDNTTEVPFEYLCERSGTQEKKAVAVFDPETFMLYAVRLTVSTETSSAEETVALPLEQIK